MAELGAVASAVQLADVALRISGEVCKFLDAYKSADRNAKLLWDALRDVEANVRNLRRYVIQFRDSKAAVDEFENLSETIIGALHGYDADILAVKRILPAKPLEKVKEKARWALKKRETQELMERITQRNSNLTTALGIIESQQSLRIRKDTQEILAKQTTSDVFASSSLTEINLKLQKQEENHVELLSQSKNIVASIKSMKLSSTRQHKTLASVATEQATLANDRLKHISKQASQLAQNTKETNTKLYELNKQIQKSSKQTQQTIDAIVAGMKGIHTRTTFSASGIDAITKVIREEIRATLTPLVEEVFDQKETRREEALRRLGNLNDAITHEISSDISAQRTAKTSDLHSLHTANSDEILANQQHKELWRMRREPNAAQPLAMTQDSSSLHYTISTYKRMWSHESSFGCLGIQVTHTNHRINASPQSQSHTTVEVHFLPSQKYLNLPRVSAFYCTAPTPEGYYQLAPTIAIYPILADNNVVFPVLESGDLTAFQKMLASGQIHLRSCDSMGRTLLHRAAWHLNVEICQFLRDQGLVWYEESVEDSDFASLRNLLFPYIHHPWQAGILETLLDVLDTIQYSKNYKYVDFFWLCYYYACGVSRGSFDYSQFERDFRRRWPDNWDQFRADVLSIAILGLGFDHSSDTIEQLLRSGVNPNLLGGDWERPLTLVLALADVHKHEGCDIIPNPDSEWQLPPRKTLDNPEETFGVPSRSAYERYFPCITLLIMGGADIYHIEPTSFDKAKHWVHLLSHSQIAMDSGIFDGWRVALERSGRDPDYVLLEDERRRKQTFRLRGATRSGVDEATLDPPPIDGLRCRRCRRKYCNYHDPYIFE